jgi:hypothetical protein
MQRVSSYLAVYRLGAVLELGNSLTARHESTRECADTIELNRTGTLPPTRNLKPNLKASPKRFTHAKSAQSVNHDINTRDLTSRHTCLEIKFGFKKKIGSLSEGDVSVIIISMADTSI